MKIITFLLTFFLLTACSTHVIPVSPANKLPPYAGHVSVFRAEADAPMDYTVVAAIAHYDWGKYQVLTIDDAIPALQSRAQAQGANAIIIDSCETVYSGIFSRGVDVKARAILIK